MSMPSDQAIRDAIGRILDRYEFRNVNEEIADWIGRRLLDQLLNAIEQTSDMTGIPVMLLVVFGVFLLGLIIFFVVRGLRLRRLEEAGPQEGEHPLQHQNPYTVADRLAEEEKYGEALIWLFYGHIKDLDAAGLLVAHPSKTNLQYEWELRYNRYQGLERFREFKNLFNSVRYGGRSVGPEAFVLWRSHCGDARKGGAAA